MNKQISVVCATNKAENFRYALGGVKVLDEDGKPVAIKFEEFPLGLAGDLTAFQFIFPMERMKELDAICKPSGINAKLLR